MKFHGSLSKIEKKNNENFQWRSKNKVENHGKIDWKFRELTSKKKKTDILNMDCEYLKSVKCAQTINK